MRITCVCSFELKELSKDISNIRFTVQRTVLMRSLFDGGVVERDRWNQGEDRLSFEACPQRGPLDKARALKASKSMVEPRGIEPLTSSLRTRRSPS